jgi:hypothetical protein
MFAGQLNLYSLSAHRHGSTACQKRQDSGGPGELLAAVAVGPTSMAVEKPACCLGRFIWVFVDRPLYRQGARSIEVHVQLKVCDTTQCLLYHCKSGWKYDQQTPPASVSDRIMLILVLSNNTIMSTLNTCVTTDCVVLLINYWKRTSNLAFWMLYRSTVEFGTELRTANSYCPWH